MCNMDPGLSIRDFLHKSGEAGQCYQESKCESCHITYDESYRFSQREGTYVQELEDISSNLMRLLSKARQSTFKNVTFPMHMTESNIDRCQTHPNVNANDFPANKATADSPETNERKKKETHNQSERKRRSFINNKITELRNLLPEHIDRALCKKKGVVLKESIEYIKQLRQDHYRIQDLLRRMSETEIEVKKLTFKLMKLELHMSALVSSIQMETFEQPETSTKSSHYQSSSELESPPTIQLPQYEILTTTPVR